MQNWKPEQFCKFHLSVKLPSKTCSILLNVKAITEMSRENCPTDLHQRWTAGPIPILAFRAARSEYKRALGVGQPEPQLVSYLEDLQTCWCLRFHTDLCGLVLSITWALHCSTLLLHYIYIQQYIALGPHTVVITFQQQRICCISTIVLSIRYEM